MLVPGQAAWDNAVNAYYQGHYGAAAGNAAAMVTEQVLTVTAMRMTQAPTAIIGGTTASTTTAAATNGLVASSEGVMGGHTIMVHVGRTSAELAERLATERIPSASTFSTLGEAETAVSSVIRANAGRFADWLAAGAQGRLTMQAPFVGGQVLVRGAAETVVGSQARVTLQGNGSGVWALFTAMLEP
jgi:hypothetical protein